MGVIGETWVDRKTQRRKSVRMRADVFSGRYRILSNRANDRTRVSNTVANADAGSVGWSEREAGSAARRCGLG
jgi:hypothetical protein